MVHQTVDLTVPVHCATASNSPSKLPEWFTEEAAVPEQKGGGWIVSTGHRTKRYLPTSFGVRAALWLLAFLHLHRAKLFRPVEHPIFIPHLPLHLFFCDDSADSIHTTIQTCVDLRRVVPICPQKSPVCALFLIDSKQSRRLRLCLLPCHLGR